MNTDICFGVRIQTYNAPAKRKPTREYVAEAIDSVCRQTYPNWKIFLMGDRYEPNSEFRELAKLAPPDKIVAINMPRAPEREIHSGYKLWCCGGMTTFNFTLDLMTELGITHTATLDDDDIWFPRHLEFHAQTYNEEKDAVLVVTHGHYKVANYILPKHDNAVTAINTIAGNSCQSAITWDLVRMPTRAVNCIQETAWATQAGDFWFWRTFEDESAVRGYRMVLRPEISVFQRHSHLKDMSIGHL